MYVISLKLYLLLASLTAYYSQSQTSNQMWKARKGGIENFPSPSNKNAQNQDWKMPMFLSWPLHHIKVSGWNLKDGGTPKWLHV